MQARFFHDTRCDIAAGEGKDDSVECAPDTESKLRLLPRVNTSDLEQDDGGNPEHQVPHENSKQTFYDSTSVLTFFDFCPTDPFRAIIQIRLMIAGDSVNSQKFDKSVHELYTGVKFFDPDALIFAMCTDVVDVRKDS